MRSFSRSRALCVALVLASLASCAPARPPVARVVPKALVAHGETRVDPYYWLRYREKDPGVLAYLRAENAYSDQVMKPQHALLESLYREMVARSPEVEESAQEPDGAFLYWSRTVAGKPYKEHLRRGIDTSAGPGGAQSGTGAVYLDENALAAGASYFKLGVNAPSPDQRMLAYGVDREGGETYTLRFRDLVTGKDLQDSLSNAYAGVAWASDSRTIFYATVDAAKRPFKVWRHVLGTSPSSDALVHHEADEKFYVSLRRSRSGAFVFIFLDSQITTEVRFIDAAAPASAPKLFEARKDGVEYRVDHRGDRFFAVTNDGAKNFRLVEAPVASPGRASWKELVAHRDDVKLHDLDAFAEHVVLHEWKDGLRRARILELAAGTWHDVTFPEPAYALESGPNLTFGNGRWRYVYSSFVTPPTTVDYDLRTRARTVVRRAEVRGYDPSRYEALRIFATSHDGVKVPISLVLAKGAKRDGSHALYLSGYGAYGYNWDVGFSKRRVSMMERGIVFAHAHVRGGSELGRDWYENGKFLKKRNTFLDFIAAAEHLVRAGYTRPERLVASGKSAGGLLVGAVANLRPDLFRAVVARVPFVDVLTTMLDATIPLTVTEYEEWGNPQERAYYDYMRGYSPYDNVVKKAYPAMLVSGSLNDSSVPYWEPAKWVAKLRANKTDNNPLLLRTTLAGGHSGPSGRFASARESAFELAFLLGLVGLQR